MKSRVIPQPLSATTQLSPSILITRLNRHQSVFVDCVGSIQKQVHDHALELFAIRDKLWNGLKIFHPFRASAASTWSITLLSRAFRSNSLGLSSRPSWSAPARPMSY